MHSRAFLRVQPTHFEKTDAGWAIRQEWEVVCPECGDDAGPYDRQTAEIQAIRGPYGGAADAEHAAKAHLTQMGAPAAEVTIGPAAP